MDTAPDNRDAFRIYSGASIGAAIRHYRQQAGLSQAGLADLAGLNRTYLASLESGEETERMTRILRVMRRLGVRMVMEKADW